MAQTPATGFACPSCGRDMLYLGKLPAIGFHVAVYVFKCQTCMTITSKVPEEAVVTRWHSNEPGRQREEVIE
jgi:C4-type Zn-finger protein